MAPDQIAFVAFTRAAAQEASRRAAEKFGLDAEHDLPWFRTIHSMAYAKLGISRDEIMGSRDWAEFGELIGERVGAPREDEDGTPIPAGDRRGDIMARLVDYAATTMMGLTDVWHELEEPISWHELKRFDAALTDYKVALAKMDYTDLLLIYAREGTPLDVEVAVIDEAQDLTAAQWAVVRRAFANARRVYIGGDDDQAIYRWSGADVNYFLNLNVPSEILPVSHRLPANVWALSQGIANRIHRRYAKQFANTGRAGVVEWYRAPEEVDLSAGTWFLLARNNYMLTRLEKLAQAQGVPYRRKDHYAINQDDARAIALWTALRADHDRDLSAKEVRQIFKATGRSAPQLKELSRYRPDEFGYDLSKTWQDVFLSIPEWRRQYYEACLGRGEDILSGEPRVVIETIHGVKGGQAEHVLLMTDLSRRTAASFLDRPDDEHRVFYVGMTRASEGLHLIMPQGVSGYQI